MNLHTRVITSSSLAIFSAVLVASARQDSETRGTASVEGLPAIPDLYSPQGKLTREGMLFTTQAYQREALKLVLREANDAARQLQLPERLPITESTLEGMFIGPYGMTRVPPKAIGNVHTRTYAYFVSIDHKLSYVRHVRYEEACKKWRSDCVWPVSRLDTNGAYQLATQWLAAVSMDVEALNRDCKLLIRPNPYWNRGIKKRSFVPIYDVHWLSADNQANNDGDVAYVSLFAPTRTLISLNVREPKYILRDPIVFTNLNELLSEPERPMIAPPE